MRVREKKALSPDVLLGILLFAVAFCSVLHAVAKPFWYDEICTLIVCRLPGPAAIWNALDKALDGNPPVFYIATRAARQLVPDDHLGYRVISIVGLLVSILAIYLFLARRLDRVAALLGASFLLCTALAEYAYEARPYTSMVGCIAVAMLAWQRIDDSRWYVLTLASALALAESLHYYAIFAWPAFVAAEAAVWFVQRRFRPFVWVAVIAGTLPLLVFRDLLINMRHYSGAHFWAHPNIVQIFLIHGWLLNVDGALGFGVAAGLSVILALNARRKVIPTEEQVLVLTILWLPFIAVTASMAVHGGMTNRYMMPAVLGAAVAIGQLSSQTPGVGKLFLAAVILVNFGIQSMGVTQAFLRGTLNSERNAVTRTIRTDIERFPLSKQTVVVSSALEYLPMLYYAPEDIRKRLTILVDPASELQIQGSDSTDLALMLQRNYFPMRAVNYAAFASKHRSFVLLSQGNMDWWPARLSHDGEDLRLLSESGRKRVYQVNLKPAH